MKDRLLLARLPIRQESFARIFRQIAGAVLLHGKIIPLYSPGIDFHQHKTVGDRSSKFFQQVQRQRTAARAQLMQKADARIQPHRFQRRGTFLCKQRIGKRQQCIDAVARRPSGAPGKAKRIAIPEDSLRKNIKICLCSKPLLPQQAIDPLLLQQSMLRGFYSLNRLLEPVHINA